MPINKKCENVSKHFFIPHKIRPNTKHQKQHSRHIFCKNYMPNFGNQVLDQRHLGAQSPCVECLIAGLHPTLLGCSVVGLWTLLGQLTLCVNPTLWTLKFLIPSKQPIFKGPQNSHLKFQILESFSLIWKNTFWFNLFLMSFSFGHCGCHIKMQRLWPWGWIIGKHLCIVKSLVLVTWSFGFNLGPDLPDHVWTQT
jgi:hypothetical protein